MGAGAEAGACGQADRMLHTVTFRWSLGVQGVRWVAAGRALSRQLWVRQALQSMSPAQPFVQCAQ